MIRREARRIKTNKNKGWNRKKQKGSNREDKHNKEVRHLFTIVQVLERSGILDAYEYFLRAICKNGLPEANIFEFAAQQILKYQKKVKQQ